MKAVSAAKSYRGVTLRQAALVAASPYLLNLLATLKFLFTQAGGIQQRGSNGPIFP